MRKKRTRRTLLAEPTIRTKLRAIKNLSKQVNLWDSEAVGSHIDNAPVCNGRKDILQYAYADWCKSKGFDYETKYYPEDEKLPHVPTEKDIDQLIGGFNNSKYGTFIQLIKETGFRPVEASRLTPENIDVDRRIVTLNRPAKNGKPRQLKLSEKCVAMLMPLLRDVGVKERIWSS